MQRYRYIDHFLPHTNVTINLKLKICLPECTSLGSKNSHNHSESRLTRSKSQIIPATDFLLMHGMDINNHETV